MNKAQPCRGSGSHRRRFVRRTVIGLLGFVACALAFSLQPLSAANVVHYPYLQNLGPDHVTIVWSARENQSAAVQYSSDTSFSRSAPARVVRAFSPAETGMEAFFQYHAELTGLAPGTSYSYRVMVGGENITPEPDHRFRTANFDAFSFLVLGDSGDGSSHQLAVTLQMIQEQPNFVIHVGDIAYQSGTFSEFTANYFSYYASLMRRACFFTVAGNHEYYTQDSAPYLALHAPPVNSVPEPDRGRYYSFDWGSVHFVGLDANLLDPRFSAAKTRMLSWLADDLTKTRALWKVAFFHQTPYPTSHHIDDPIDIAARQEFVPILERHGVQVVLAGHEHNYQRSKPLHSGIPASPGSGTVYMVTGGGGGVPHPVSPQSFLDYQADALHYLKVDVDGTKLTIHAIGTDGKEFDRLALTLPPSVGQPGGVVNGASFTTSLGAGGLVSIFGQWLAAGISQAYSFPLPNNLGGTTVTVNNIPMPLTYVSPSQINASLPLDSLGPAMLRVITPGGTAEARVIISDTAPAIFPYAIAHSDGSLVSPSSPVTPGERLVIYLTGLGQVDGKLAAGQPAPSTPLFRALGPVEVQIGEISLVPEFAGLTPGLVGVYQVNVVVPQNLPSRIYPVRVSVNGNVSNPQSIPLQGRNP